MKEADYKPGSSPKSISYYCYTDKNVEGEAFVDEHVFNYIISGTHEIWIGNQLYSYKPGDYRFLKRNQLTKYIKKPSKEGFKSISVRIDQNTLKQISQEEGLKGDSGYTGKSVQLLKSNTYFDHYIDSLTPYTDHKHTFDDQIVNLKIRELIFILLETNPALKNVLFDFSDPGKVDLEAFMNTHYRYNVGLDHFAFLTGRSLSSFKRDFVEHFHTTPGKWLTQKRLEEAHYLLKTKKKAPSEIYLELGFEDLSHFSFAYKKAYGTSPSVR